MLEIFEKCYMLAGLDTPTMSKNLSTLVDLEETLTLVSSSLVTLHILVSIVHSLLGECWSAKELVGRDIIPHGVAVLVLVVVLVVQTRQVPTWRAMALDLSWSLIFRL